MGYNRAGRKRRDRLKRRKREETRLANKAAQSPENESGGQPGGITATVKGLAQGAVAKVTHLVEAAVHKVTGAGEEKK